MCGVCVVGSKEKNSKEAYRRSISAMVSRKEIRLVAFAMMYVCMICTMSFFENWSPPTLLLE